MAIRNYFKAGLWNGLGRTVKRHADNAIKQNKFVIQEVSDLCTWDREQQSESEIDYVPMSSNDYELIKSELKSGLELVKPVHGAVKVHAVVGLSCNNVMVRSVSRLCSRCFEGTQFYDDICYDGWDRHSIARKQPKSKKR